MGFLDKAKKMAEQAQTKLEEVQKDFNEKQGSSSSGGHAGPGNAVEYDEHGRPKTPPTPQTPADLPATGSGDLATPVGDPLTADPTAPAAATPNQGDPLTGGGPTIDPSGPGATPDSAPAKTQGDALLSGEHAEREESPKPPPSGGGGLTSGDPLG